MKKRLIFEVEEGNTKCDKCPFRAISENDDMCGDRNETFDCCKYDLSTLKFIGEESLTINKQGNEND